MHFIHDLSPHITLSKYDALDDKDLPSQPIKEDMNTGSRKEILPTKDIPSSSNSTFYPSMFPYTTNLK